jgi:hypothetical protein
VCVSLSLSLFCISLPLSYSLYLSAFLFLCLSLSLPFSFSAFLFLSLPLSVFLSSFGCCIHPVGLIRSSTACMWAGVTRDHGAVRGARQAGGQQVSLTDAPCPPFSSHCASIVQASEPLHGHDASLRVSRGRYPKNSNVAAMLALGSRVGLDRTQV